MGKPCPRESLAAAGDGQRLQKPPAIPWRRRTAPLLDTYPAAGPEEQTLLEAIGRLPAKDRTVLHLYYYEGYQTAEIAEMTGWREGTVRSRMTRARARLGALLKGDLQ